MIDLRPYLQPYSLIIREGIQKIGIVGEKIKAFSDALLEIMTTHDIAAANCLTYVGLRESWLLEKALKRVNENLEKYGYDEISLDTLIWIYTNIYVIPGLKEKTRRRTKGLNI